VELLQLGASKVDQEAAHYLKVQLHFVKSETGTRWQRAYINSPAHPTWKKVQAECEAVSLGYAISTRYT